MTPEIIYLCVVAIFGLIIGSFLNVVIYRLPRDLSIASPKWSFCPHCTTPINATDNIPVLGWLRLGGKCRSCRAPISLQYPLVELITAIVFVAVYDAACVDRVIPSVATGFAGVPTLVAWLGLFACMVAVSAMDLEEYLVDLGVTNFATVLGTCGIIAAHLFVTRTSGLPMVDLRISGAATIGLIVAVVLMRRFEIVPNQSWEEMPQSAPTPAGGRAPIIALLIGLLLLLGLVAMPQLSTQWIQNTADEHLFAIIRPVFAISMLWVILVIAMAQDRPADDQLSEALEQEAAGTRRVVLREALLISGGLAAAALTWLALGLLSSAPSGGIEVTGESDWWLRAIAGLCRSGTSVAGIVLLIYGIRIAFSLLRGREALGVGDIHILAALAALGGFWFALVSFLAAAILGLTGAITTLVSKSSRVLSFGPWISLGALVALWCTGWFEGRVLPPLKIISSNWFGQ